MRHSTILWLQSLVVYLLKFTGIIMCIVVLSWLTVRLELVPCVPTRRIQVADTSLWACIADTPHAQMRGLSGTRYLPSGWAMLFVFDEYNHHRFWMKDMSYPIDIFWLNDNLVPIEVARNASPESYPGYFYPTYATRYVVETNPNEITGDYEDAHYENE